METIFMNTENSKRSESYRFRLDLTDKLNLKNPNKNMALIFITLGTTLNQNAITINLKFLHQIGMIHSIYLMVLILLQIFKIILNLLLKNKNL